MNARTITRPETPGLYLLDGQLCRVIMAWSRMALMIAEGPQAGMSVGLVKGTWQGPVGSL